MIQATHMMDRTAFVRFHENFHSNSKVDVLHTKLPWDPSAIFGGLSCSLKYHSLVTEMNMLMLHVPLIIPFWRINFFSLE